MLRGLGARPEFVMNHTFCNTQRWAVLGGVAGGILLLCINIGPSFGGRITGVAYLGEIAVAAVVGAVLAMLLALVLNRVMRA